MNARLLASFLIFQVAASAQTGLRIRPFWGETPIELGKNQVFRLPDGDSARLEKLKFYVSNVRFFQSEKLVFAAPDRFFLIDAADEKSGFIEFKNAPTSFDELRFCLGVDSATSVSGVFGGALDPVLGMYWTWQSGYVNFKIEGASRRSGGRKGAFAFHLGGWDGPQNALKEVVLRLEESTSGAVEIAFDAAVFFEKIDLRREHSILSPSRRAVELAGEAARAFKIQKP